MKRFCANLRNYATEVIKYEKKEMLPLTDEEIGSYINQIFYHICQKILYDVDDINNNDDNDDSNDHSNDEEFNTRELHEMVKIF